MNPNPKPVPDYKPEIDPREIVKPAKEPVQMPSHPWRRKKVA